MSGVTIYAVEHGDYSDRETEVLFSTEALAKEYIAARVNAARRADEGGDWEYQDWYYESHWDIVPYRLWDVLPVVPESLSLSGDVAL